MAVSDIERGLVTRYIARVLERGDLPLRATRYILVWLNERAEMFNIELPSPIVKAIGTMYSGGYKASEFEKAYRKSREKIISLLREAAEETDRPEPLASNIEHLVSELGLPKSAWKIVGLVACYTRYDQVQYLCDAVTEVAGPLARAMAIMVGEPSRSVEQLIAPSGDLPTSGLLQLKEGDEVAGYSGRFAIPNRVNNCLDQTYNNFNDLHSALLGEPAQSRIELGDYDHVALDRELIVSVLKGAVDAGAEGVNILLYGPPGSGKTELTKVAAETVGLSLYVAGEEISASGESDRSERLSDLVFSMRLLASAKRSAILFDEMEDVAWQLLRRGGSKVFLNRLLEKNPVPVLWTSNNINEIDPALLRRMTLAIELKAPPASQRQKILRRVAERHDVSLTDEEIETLAARLDATPAIIENALKAARYSGGGVEAVERAALGIMRAVSGQTAKRPGRIPEFDLKLSAASIKLDNLTSQLEAGGKLNFSLCLSGPPGTGKSAYARHLAHTLNLEVLQKRASDLLGAFVGESEKRIADAFEEARETKSFLIFDEADSLLFDRSQATRSWEITQVNEMLTWMEEHPLPVCFTTNLMDRMDSASLRRFTFHIRFDYLNRQALERAFNVFFGMNGVHEDGLRLENLTPGDFAQARKQAEVLGISQDMTKVIALLTDISRGKPGGFGTVGFVK